MDTPLNKTMTAEEHVKVLVEEMARREAEKIALVAEFSKANDPEAIGNTAREAIKDMLPDAIIQMHDLLVSSGSDGVKAGIAKFVMQTALDKTKLEDETDTSVRKLLEQLGANAVTDNSRKIKPPASDRPKSATPPVGSLDT